MNFRNKETDEIIEVDGYTLEFAYSHNSNWEKINETKKKASKSKSTIK